MKTLVLGLAAAAFSAVTVLACHAYASVGMQLAWEHLLAFCGH
jgi:hypothetical protein